MPQCLDGNMQNPAERVGSQTGVRSGGEREGPGRIRLVTSEVRQTLALILHTIRKIRAVFQFLLEPVVMVVMSYD